MKNEAIIVSLGLLFVMTGCIPSVHPLYTDQDLIFDPSLVGQWADKSGKETWTFTANGEKQYKLLYVDEDDKQGEFAVHLLKIADRRFLDIYPADPKLQQNDFYKGHLMPVHTFMRVQMQNDVLQMAFMKPDWIKDFLQKNPAAIKHEKVNDDVLLTAQPKDLQAFLTQHEKTPDAWNEGNPLARSAEKPKP
jgi:hypothetical protein